jgi:hypothetical protein
MNVTTDDAVELGQLCASFALNMTKGDVHHIMENVFTADGTYSAFGETYGLGDWPELVAAAPKGLFLTGEPVLKVNGDSGSGEVPLLFIDLSAHGARLAPRDPQDDLSSPSRRGGRRQPA